MRTIYLDNSATTPLDPLVKKAMDDFWYKKYGNPSSLHHKGREAKQELIKSRKKVAKIINCKPEEIIFTAGGTESINMALIGIAFANKKSGNHIIISNIEHPAVLATCNYLDKHGFDITILSVEKDGILNPKKVEKAITSKTILISAMQVNNEIGTIQPITEISKIIQAYNHRKHANIYFHTDSCQAGNYLNINVKRLGVDAMTLNGSKIYGPKQTGILYIKQDTQIQPYIYGGGQENKLRSGTENMPGIIGFTKALEIAQKKKATESKRLEGLRDWFIKEILKQIPDTILNGHIAKRLPNNINISFMGVEGESMVLFLDKYGICVSSGSACSSTKLTASHIIMALEDNHERAHSSIRFSLGRYTTKKDLEFTLKIIKQAVEKLRNISAV